MVSKGGMMRGCLLEGLKTFSILSVVEKSPNFTSIGKLGCGGLLGRRHILHHLETMYYKNYNTLQYPPPN